VVAVDDLALHALLDCEAKLVSDREVEPAIHDPEAVRGAQHRASRVREVVILVHGDVIATSRHARTSAGSRSSCIL